MEEHEDKMAHITISLKGGCTTLGSQKIDFYFLFFKYSCMSKEAEFQVLESYVASFSSYDFFCVPVLLLLVH